MNLIHEIIRGVWNIDKAYADQYMPLVFNLLKGNDIALNNRHSEDPNNSSTFSSLAILNAGKPYTASSRDIRYFPEDITEASVFVLDLRGPITKYDQGCGPVGMKTKSDLIKKADLHSNIFAHVICIDSGGGEGYAGRLMAETLASLSKPVFSFIEDIGASAAYMIPAGTSYVVANSPQARIGSIGSYISVNDYREMLKNEGIREIDVYADKSKDKNRDYLAAIDGDESLLKKLINQYNDFFLAHVQKSRGDKLTSNDWDSGKMFFAEDAKALGLIDDIMSFDELLTHIFNEFSPKTP
jgi:ClpP class serine protease